jgi:hypothetical protein
MAKLPTDTEPANWHRYFAIDCNNRAWDLAAKNRTPVEDAEMLNAAYASSYHWSAVGTELHSVRAKMLVARVQTLVGNGAVAVQLAGEMRAYFATHGAPDWEMAFAHAIYAHAAFVAGEREIHRAAYNDAIQALSVVASEQDRALIRETLDLVPAPQSV